MVLFGVAMTVQRRALMRLLRDLSGRTRNGNVQVCRDFRNSCSCRFGNDCKDSHDF